MINFKERLLKEKQFHAGSIILQNEIAQMDEAEAIIYLVWYNEWRIGAVDEMPELSKLTEAINIIVKEYKKRNL
jgi:hypothetical protein